MASAMFFVLFFVAALTSAISLLEVVSALLHRRDEVELLEGLVDHGNSHLPPGDPLGDGYRWHYLKLAGRDFPGFSRLPRFQRAPASWRFLP